MKQACCLFLLVVVAQFLTECEKEEGNNTSFNTSLAFTVPFDTIRSCPGGGGILILGLTEMSTIHGDVTLSIKSDPKLNAMLTREVLHDILTTGEIYINPSNDCPVNDYTIEITAGDSDKDTTINLVVQMFDWSTEINEDMISKREEFVGWIHEQYPELNITTNQNWNMYITYPQILIVEHATFYNDDYELRLCRHVMIAPDDWAMMRIRKRNQIEPTLTLKQNSSGEEIFTIPVSDYPLLFGY
jgi:hypothetical protein